MKKERKRFGLLLIILLAACLRVSAQGRKITLSFKNTPLTEALYQIEKQGGSYHFSYNTDDLQQKTVSADIHDMDVPAAVNAVLQGLPFRSAVKGNTITISRFGLGKTEVSGQLIDDNGEPLIGASVRVVGTNTGTITDSEGRYHIAEVPTGAELEYSYLGMKTLRRKADGKPLKIILQRDEHTLGDVVVTGYQTLKREDATGAFQTISNKDLDNRYTGDITSNLEGKIAGLVKYDNGVTKEMAIRGISSLSANTSPLVVVNGLPINESIETINPYDIESITVLKDAAAAAIYGARASNGVIVVVTKKATREKLQVDFNADLNISQKRSYNNFGYASAAEEIELNEDNFNWLKDNDEWSFSDLEASYDRYDGRHNTPMMQLMMEHYKGNITDEEYNATKAKWSQNNYKKEWEDLMLRHQVTQQYNLSLRTKGKYLNSSINANYKSDNTGMTGLHDRTFVGSYDGHLDIAKWADASFGVYVESERTRTRMDMFNLMGINSFYNYETMWDENGNPLSRKGLVNLSEPNLSDPQYGLKSEAFVLQDEINKNYCNTRSTLIRPYVSLNVHPIADVTLSGQFQYEDVYSKSEGLYQADSYTMRHLYNLYTYKGKHYLPDGGLLDVNTNDGAHFTFRTQGTYNHTFAEKHAVEFVAGMEYRQMKTRATSNELVGYDDQTQTNSTFMTNLYDLYRLNSCDISSSFSPVGYRITDFTSSETLHRYFSYYFTGNYTWNHLYSLSGSYRVDKTDLFGSDPKFRGRPLWSAGLSWNMHNEAWMKDIKWINMLKLRTSYGLTGNINSNYTSYLTAKIKTDYIYGNKRAVLQTPPNDQLRWEKTASWNIGADFSLLDNRLRGSLDYYLKNSSDVLSETDIDPSQGWESLTINNAKIRNQGVELQLSADILRARSRNQVGVSADFSLAYNSNKVTGINHEITSGYEALESSSYHLGKPVHSLYSMRYGGLAIDENGDQQAYLIKADGTKIAVPTYDSNFEAADAVYSGSLDPKLSGSLTPSVSYKGFTLSAMMVFYAGHVMRINANQWTIQMNSEYDEPIYSSMLNYWRSEDKTAYLANGNPAYNMRMFEDDPAKFDINVVHADYMKVRNIVLAYQLPEQWCRAVGVGSISLRVQMNNVLTWVRNAQGIDPEANDPYTGMPLVKTPKSWTFSLGVTL
mgnify:FL=1